MSLSRTALSAKSEFAANREKSKSLFSSINRYRASKNVPALTWNDTLYSYCVLHNIDMHGSVVKSSNFALGHGYNENVAHVPGSSKKVMDVWRSRSEEKGNLLFNSAKYSAIAVYGDHSECYATQIFMEQRPKKNDKVVSMKTQKNWGTGRSGKSIASKGISSAGLKAKSLASTKLRTKNSLSLAKFGASSMRPATSSFFGRTGPARNQSLLKNVGNMGQSIRTSIASGMKSLGGALDETLPSGKQPSRTTERITRARRSVPATSSSNSLPYTFDRGSRPKRSAARPSFTGNGFSRMDRRNGGYERDSFECTLCRYRRSRQSEFCDTCSTRM